MNISRMQVDFSTEEEEKALLESFRLGYHAIGPDQQKFEIAIAERCGLSFALGCSNGFFALLLALCGLNLNKKYIGIPAIQTCSAVASAVRASGNIPVYLDCDYLGRLTSESCDTAQELSAVVSVSYFGVSIDSKSLESDIGIPVVEDASQSFLTSLYKSNFPSALVFSFYPTKGFSAIDGGMLLSNRSDLITRARLKSSYNALDEKNSFDFGYNTRLSNLSAVIGLTKLDDILTMEKKNRLIFDSYNSALSGKDITMIGDLDKKEYLTRCVLKFATEKIRDKFLSQSKEYGIETCIEWYVPEEIKNNEKEFRKSIMLANLTASIPAYNNLNVTEIEYIANFIKQF